MQDSAGSASDGSPPGQMPGIAKGIQPPSRSVLEMLKQVYRYAKNLREVAILVGFYVALAPFVKPTLEVTYQLDQLHPPIAAEAYLGEISETEDVVGVAGSPLARLVTSRDILRICIRNNSSERIEDLDLRLDGSAVADVAIHSNSSRVMGDRKRLAEFKASDEFEITFPNLTSIPPKAKIEMILWGDFRTFGWYEPVRVSAATKGINVVRQATVSGVKLFVAGNLFWLGLVLAVGLLLLGLRRFQ